jgi:hypothetical protein
MNSLKNQPLPISTKIINFIQNWLFRVTFNTNQSENGLTHSMRYSIINGWINFGATAFIRHDMSGVTMLLGMKRFHFDLDLVYTPRPEDERRNDKRSNSIKVEESHSQFESWFLGYEGVGIYRERSTSDDLSLSRLEIGAHPMIGLGIYNFYHPATQQAVLGIQLFNFQISLHSAMDSQTK